MTLEQLARPFSLPVEAPETLFDAVICADGAARTRIFLQRHEAAIRSRSRGLTDYLEEWLSEPNSRTMASFWDLSFGQIGLSLKDGRIDPVDAAARLALRAAESGHAGAWSADLPAAPHMCGGYLVEDVRRIEATTSSEGAIIIGFSRDTDGATVAARGQAWESKEAEILPQAGPGVRARLTPARALPHNAASGFFFDCGAVARIDHAAANGFRESFQALAEAAPEYASWVDRVLTGLVVTDLHASYRVMSGSWQEAPGYMHASHPHPPFEIAEILVHECAHQYFYMLERLGPFDDGSDTELYWSPVAGVKRPLSRILMAYHAMANVLRLYRRIEAASVDDGGYVEANLPGLLVVVEQLAAPLRDNPALTPLGRGLFEPLDGGPLG